MLSNWQPPMWQWCEFEEQMKRQFPFLPERFMQDNTHRIEENVRDYVQNAINRFLPNPMPARSGSPRTSSNPPPKPHAIAHRLFETHTCIFVRIRLPSRSMLKKIRLSVNRRSLIMDCSSVKKEIVLPHDVIAARSSASYKRGVLEVRMPKAKKEPPYRRIPIR